MPVSFYKRPPSVRVFATWKKFEEEFCLYEMVMLFALTPFPSMPGFQEHCVFRERGKTSTLLLLWDRKILNRNLGAVRQLTSEKKLESYRLDRFGLNWSADQDVAG